MNPFPNSPDFNPIETVWYISKSRIQTRRGNVGHNYGPDENSIAGGMGSHLH